MPFCMFRSIWMGHLEKQRVSGRGLGIFVSAKRAAHDNASLIHLMPCLPSLELDGCCSIRNAQQYSHCVFLKFFHVNDSVFGEPVAAG
jgi:hypothetical protein